MYSADGYTLRRYLRNEYHLVCTPDPGSGTGTLEIHGLYVLNKWTGHLDTNIYEILSGGGYPSDDFVRTVNTISVDDSAAYASITYVGTTYTVNVTINLSLGETFDSAIARCISLYTATPALTLTGGGGTWTYDSTGAVISDSVSAYPFGPLGHSLNVGMHGSIVGDADVVLFKGVVYSVNEPAWYVKTQTYDLANSITSTTNVSRPPFMGLYLLENLSPYTEAQAYAGIP